ncbi:MAG: putative selenium-dependent hydroxylase accessory protein YqeC [Spirochaetales bacterium]|nr:putative selenium-dependent hydroxylase accessory protein YqeC [Spirochaetales bacterium]
MDIYETLSTGFDSDHEFVSITGGGGKTTLMTGLSSYLRSCGKRVLMTTTTKIRSPYLMDYKADRIFSDDSVLSYTPDGPCIVVYAVEDAETGKWSCPPLENLDALRLRYDVIICEADGSRGLPLKIHTGRDPVVPSFATHTISVMGLWGIGHEARSVAFGDDRPLIVDRSYLNWYLKDPEGLLKGSLPGHRAIVFNGADSFSETGILRDLDYPDDVLVFTASEQEGVLYEQIRFGV